MLYVFNTRMKTVPRGAGTHHTRGTHGHTDHTDEPHNHPNPPTHAHARPRATTESGAED